MVKRGKGYRDRWVRKVRSGQKGLPGNRARKAKWAPLAFPALMGYPAQMDYPVLTDETAQMGNPANLAHKGPRAFLGIR